MPLAPETLGWFAAATIAECERETRRAISQEPRRLDGLLRAEPAVDEDARHRAERQLNTSVGQAELASMPATLTGADGLVVPGVALLGVDRARALRLGYKRGVWAVIGLSAEHAVVVFTGINSRQKTPEE